MEASAFEKELQEKTALAERVLREHLPMEEGMQKKIMEAMNYSLMAGGKRLRPILMWEAYRMCGGEPGAAIEHFMAAIEMIHTYSLVHDDLPAMDNDRYRRGRETTWYVYGDAMGILAGDGLLNYAFETAARAFRDCAASGTVSCEGIDGEESGRTGQDARALSDAERLNRMERAARALAVLSGKAGIYGMIGGQVVDVMEEKGLAQRGPEGGSGGVDAADTDLPGGGCGASDAAEGSAEDIGNRLLFIHAHKTAALIEAAMMVGAILAGASEQQVKDIERCAYNIGIAFQIQDDILDVVGDSEELGKPIGSDAQNQKQTYVTWKGLEQSRADVESLSREAASILEGFSGEHEFLKQLILTLIHRRK